MTDTTYLIHAPRIQALSTPTPIILTHNQCMTMTYIDDGESEVRPFAVDKYKPTVHKFTYSERIMTHPTNTAVNVDLAVHSSAVYRLAKMFGVEPKTQYDAREDVTDVYVSADYALDEDMELLLDVLSTDRHRKLIVSNKDLEDEVYKSNLAHELTMNKYRRYVRETETELAEAYADKLIAVDNADKYRHKLHYSMWVIAGLLCMLAIVVRFTHI